MYWWTPSWLSFPSFDFAFPSTIQRRFISFVLKRSLGHFLKPGQLDVQQIDSQIGSGYVQVRDLEIDNDAVNALLIGLPVALHDGSIASVAARVPFPNPLTGNVSLSLQSLHLTFHLLPELSGRSPQSPVNLAESVVSVAETFIHDELSPGEEATLRHSFHPDMEAFSSFDNVPGGPDPFLTSEETTPASEREPDGVSIFVSMFQRLLFRFEFNAMDTMITIVHPGHSSFTFKLADIRFGRDSHSDTSFSSGVQLEGTASQAHGEAISISIAGMVFSACDLYTSIRTPLSSRTSSSETVNSLTNHSTGGFHPYVVPPTFNSGSPHLPESPVTHESESDYDEESQLLMSQSLASLPIRLPRPVSPTGTEASVMFQSAMSTLPEVSEIGTPTTQGLQVDHENSPQRDEENHPVSDLTTVQPPSAPAKDLRPETILSLEPITVRITIFVPTFVSSSSASGARMAIPADDNLYARSEDGAGAHARSVKVTVDMGVVACALRPWQVCALLELANAMTVHTSRHRSTQQPGSKKEKDLAVDATPSTSVLNELDGNLSTRGFVFLLLPTSPACLPMEMDAFFRQPLVPPKSSDSYCRVFIDGINASASVSTIQSRHASSFTKTIALTISDVSVCAFCRHPSPLPRDVSLGAASVTSVAPIIITDAYLSAHYTPQHLLPPTLGRDPDSSRDPPRLPTFPIVDWTSPANRATQPKLSQWRTRISHLHRHRHQLSADTTRSAPASPPLTSPHSPRMHTALEPSAPAVTVKVDVPSGHSRKGDPASEVNVKFSPLHCFVDLGLILDHSQQDQMRSEALVFLQDVSHRTATTLPGKVPDVTELGPRDDEGQNGGSDEICGDASRLSTPKRHRGGRQREQERDIEKERRRLERLVLEDLNLSMDYQRPLRPSRRPSTKRQATDRTSRQTSQDNKVQFLIDFPMVRLEMRCPPPPSRSPRSGALVFDIHELALRSHRRPDALPSTTRFQDDAASSPPSQIRSHILSAEWRRVVLACSRPGEDSVTAFASLGSPAIDLTEGTPFDGIPADVRREYRPSPRPAFLTLTRITPPKRAPYSNARPILMTADVPSLHVDLPKASFDSLQLWADDVSQLTERAFSSPSNSEASNHDPSLIGSRFFLDSRKGSQDSEGGMSIHKPPLPKGETVIQTGVSEVFIRLCLQREGADDIPRYQPLDVLASDIDVLLELRPGGKDQTDCTVKVVDMAVFDSANSSLLPYLAFTGPRSLDEIPKPLVSAQFTSSILPGSTAKESRIRMTLNGFTYNLFPDLQWIHELSSFVKPPPGAFESVVPNEQTKVALRIVEGSIRMFAPKHQGAFVLHIGALDFSTTLVGDSPDLSLALSVPALRALFTDDYPAISVDPYGNVMLQVDDFWRRSGYALIGEVSDLNLVVTRVAIPSAKSEVLIDGVQLQLHLCADTGGTLGAFFGDFANAFKNSSGIAEAETTTGDDTKAPMDVSTEPDPPRDMMHSLDERAFRAVPEVGSAPDMIFDDLPSNPDYLDESFGAAAGLRDYGEEDLDDFGDGDISDNATLVADDPSIVSRIGGETIKVLQTTDLDVVENYFNVLPAISEEAPQSGEVVDRVRVCNGNITMFLYEGYDWASTRQTIEHEVKEMKRRLAKIRQLVADGQGYDPNVDETNTLLFNSIYVGLQQNVDEMEPDALLAAIDDELKEDPETATQSSWQSLKPQQGPNKPRKQLARVHGHRLTRAKGSSIELRLEGLNLDVTQYAPDENLISKIFATVKDVEILDHVKSSTWRKFLTALRSDSRGNIRETGSNMVRVELQTIRPVPGHSSEEARLRAKLLPLRLHVDQDALDFLKKFFSFKDPNAVLVDAKPSSEIYLQRAEVFPVGLKLDYKPRRVDYRALRDGRTIELMNFFHFDGAEMTLRHITLFGITGWPRFFDMLNDLWTPDVKATQLADVISGVSPIRSVVNVGSGVADLVLLPIAQYRKDGRVVRGVQKGTKAFVRSTAMEAIKLGARLATGTQVILEQTENVLGSQFNETLTAETVLPAPMNFDDPDYSNEGDDDRGTSDPISKYAEQPMDIKEGIQSAYMSMRRNINSAAQTILAVPMEVYERSGNEGAVRAVIRAVPIAVLKPMIGASEAVSKALLGLHNSMDPEVRFENEAKYKHR